MIEGYIGKPGSGKTYTLTDRLLRTARSGRMVFVNYPVSAKNVYMFTPEQLLTLPPGLVVIDEAHLWMPARASLRLPPSWLAGLSQTRKNGWDLLWSTQHEARVDRVLRDVTSWMWLCSAWLSVGDHPLFFAAQSWEPEFFRSDDRRHRGVRTVRLFRRSVARAYDTGALLESAEHTRRDDDRYEESAEQARRERIARRTLGDVQ